MSKPWIVDSLPQKDSTQPGVADLYQSPTVFSNNVPIVLYAAPSGGGGAFAGVVPGPSVAVNQVAADEFAASTITPSADQIEAGGPAETQDSSSPLTDTPGAVDIAATGGDLIPWLEARVREAANGSWSRVNPPAPGAIVSRPGNPNIANIWKALGLSKNAIFQTDQQAWCMGFVNFALKSCGYTWCPETSAIAIHNNPGRWKATPVPISQAAPGDIVFWNFHHVNFVHTAKNGTLTFIGGNQSSKSVANNNNPKGSTVSISWPGGWTPAKGQIGGIYRPHKGA